MQRSAIAGTLGFACLYILFVTRPLASRLESTQTVPASVLASASAQIASLRAQVESAGKGMREREARVRAVLGALRFVPASVASPLSALESVVQRACKERGLAMPRISPLAPVTTGLVRKGGVTCVLTASRETDLFAVIDDCLGDRGCPYAMVRDVAVSRAGSLASVAVTLSFLEKVSPPAGTPRVELAAWQSSPVARESFGRLALLESPPAPVPPATPASAPAPSPAQSPSPVETAAPTPAATAMPTPAVTPTPMPTPESTATPTPVETPASIGPLAPTETPAPPPTPSAVETPAPAVTPAPMPTPEPTPTPVETPASIGPLAPTETPAPPSTPSAFETPAPEVTPAPMPTQAPVETPASVQPPTPAPTPEPVASSSPVPSPSPVATPTPIAVGPEAVPSTPPLAISQPPEPSFNGRLKGIMALGDKGVAIFDVEGVEHLVEEGESLQGWQLSRVAGDHCLLRRGRLVKTVRFARRAR